LENAGYARKKQEAPKMELATADTRSGNMVLVYATVDGSLTQSAPGIKPLTSRNTGEIPSVPDLAGSTIVVDGP
jgi:hypothetical protein